MTNQQLLAVARARVVPMRRALRLAVHGAFWCSCAALATACVTGSELRPSQAQIRTGPPPEPGAPNALERVDVIPGSRASRASMRTERPPCAPPPGTRWVRGYWHYDGVRYVWQPGRLENK